MFKDLCVTDEPINEKKWREKQQVKQQPAQSLQEIPRMERVHEKGRSFKAGDTFPDGVIGGETSLCQKRTAFVSGNRAVKPDGWDWF
jgi:hypothetical protein